MMVGFEQTLRYAEVGHQLVGFEIERAQVTAAVLGHAHNFIANSKIQGQSR